MSPISPTGKMADTSKNGLLLGGGICHITATQAEVKKFLLAYVFRHYFVCLRKRIFNCFFFLYNLPDNLPDKASPGETGSASRVTQTEIVYKVTHLYNVFPIAA